MSYTFESVKAVQSIAPVSSGAGAVNGTAVDTQDFGDGMLVVNIGAATGSPTAQTVDAKLQESANGSSGWTDIAGAAMTQATVDDVTGEIKLRIENRAGSLRYVRPVVTPGFTGGSSPEIPVSATLILGNPTYSTKVDNSVTAD
jgi:hypothetical protein